MTYQAAKYERAGHGALPSPRASLVALSPAGVITWDGQAIGVRSDRGAGWQVDVGRAASVALVLDQVWVALEQAPTVRRFSLGGDELSPLTGRGPLGAGSWLASRFSHHAVWHGSACVAFTADGAELELPDAERAAPVAQGRWLTWQAGRAALVFASARDGQRAAGPGVAVWRVQLDEPGTRLLDATPLVDGRFLALALARPGSADVRLVVIAARDGGVLSSMRLTTQLPVRIAARRAVAAVDVGDGIELLELRFGKSLRKLALADALDFVVDDALVELAWHDRASGLRRAPLASLATWAPGGGKLADEEPPALRALPAREEPPEVAEVAEVREPPDEPLALAGAPLVRLRPRRTWPTATAAEARLDLDARLELLAAQVSTAIARGWDTGRIVHVDRTRPPFVAEVGAILGTTGGLQPELVRMTRDRATQSLRLLEALAMSRGERLTPLECLARELELDDLAVEILLVVAAPSLRGDYARLYGILSHDPSRALCDEHLLVQILGEDRAADIARALDWDRPLRRGALLGVALDAPRPFAALTVEPLVLRLIAGLPQIGEPEPHLWARPADRGLAELRVPRPLVNELLRELRTEAAEPARVVVRGRLGSGRRSVCAALAELANRTLGVIDLGDAPRDTRLTETLALALQRAMVRGWLPCVQGLEHALDQDRDLRAQVAAVLRAHPGPVFLRLPPDAAPPLDPGFVLLELPPLDEHGRDRVWRDVAARRGLPAPAAEALAARYRIGPGIIERVCGELARSPLADGAATTAAADAAIRQHLDSRVSALATRVTRLATWSDVVLPDDIVDSLVEITGRIRHRRTVLERWGFNRTMTTSRGITALFSGGPGTGKTMVAGVLARDLGLDLYRIDVSRITSKWIGETEKNLGELFDAAEDGQVMLLFDEAESLFAKRTEVKSSVDRYANMEVNYLLQRLDSFEGIAILTSNFGAAIDPAFRRRLSFRVTFPFPDEEMREQLWRTLIPPEAPIAGEIDFAALARRFTLSGGYIRNASLRAAYLAVEEGSALSQAHIERAVRAEFREIGKLAETGRLD
jgi:hypothetical protein